MIFPSHSMEGDGVVDDLLAMKSLLARIDCWTRVVAVETARGEWAVRRRSSMYWAT